MIRVRLGLKAIEEAKNNIPSIEHIGNTTVRYMTAQSGEVFCVYNNNLMRFKDEKEFNNFIAHETKVRTTFFEFETDDAKYRYNIDSHEAIIRAINTVEERHKKMDLLIKYKALRREVFGE